MYGQFLIYLEPGGEMLPGKNWQLGAWFQIYTEWEIYLLCTFTIQNQPEIKKPDGDAGSMASPPRPPKNATVFYEE